jgi:DNA-binding IclR family transcriptional regulator
MINGDQSTEPDMAIRSVLSAMDVLECFATDEELGVTEVARRVGVAKSTAYRLLTTLCCRGFAEKNPDTNQYRLGLHLFELGQIAITRSKLRRAALPLLEELRQRTGSTAQLSTPHGADVIFLERLQSSRGLELLMPFGRRAPSHATSGGKAVAAFDPSLAEARRHAGFPKLTPLTTGTAREFDRQLSAVRRQGYATNFDEVALGLSSVGAPIFDFLGRPYAALSLIDISDRVRAGSEKMALLAIEAARRLSRQGIADSTR